MIALCNLILAFSLGGVALSVAAAEELTVTNVQADPRQFDANRDPAVSLRFNVNRPATVTVRIYDGRDLLIRAVVAHAAEPGEHLIEWDRRDATGRAVPSEAYVFTLTAESGSDRVIYDLTDSTGAEDLVPRAVEWSADSAMLSYVLDRPARVNVRIGLKNNGPLLKTLINWVARPAGHQQEAWDGRDASGVLDLARHPQLDVFVQAYALPDNAILVGSPQSTVQLIDPLPAPRETRRRASTADPSRRMYAHAQQPLDSRGDIAVRLVLPPELAKQADGSLVVSDRKVPVRLEIDPKDLDRTLSRRFEPVFFVDGQFAFENEVGFVPMTWVWDASTVNDGEHFLTVNVRGYEGNFGIASVKVLKQ